MTLKTLWIAVIGFSIMEWVSLAFLTVWTHELYQIIDGILIIAFIIYPLFYLLSLLLLQKGIKKAGAVILLIPFIVYAPLLMGIQELVR
ncbi:hypothetical protein PGH26_10225 [Sporosarcina jeotgali]|uniref:Uncharacterized protein n=1 Tax=Sporosarcina jeotgali TaxID=3020056 RepID=A0ABZ0KTU3_9BACL|nr:hypothetical protein [Sporosarcina sp. B2O-1]WOV83300.1 hypothetical protein PGH26_10225 [Sporosarcina sp. B2O-1]